MVLDLPPAAVAQLVGQLRLLDGPPEAVLLVARRPRPGILDLVEQIDLHGGRPFVATVTAR
ncbi:hypothetical protein [Kutzneria kofuensis]|uniref:hypothetical protein n=1 Tax=Kutzneria kofuensis TaxID=103725 RepID=UPI0031E77B39